MNNEKSGISIDEYERLKNEVDNRERDRNGNINTHWVNTEKHNKAKKLKKRKQEKASRKKNR